MIVRSVLATAAVVVLLVGCGALVGLRRCDGLDFLERLALRFATGVAASTGLVILLFELFRLPSHVSTVVLGGAIGWGLVLWVARARQSEPRIRRGVSLTVGALTIGVFAATFAGSVWYRGFGGLDPWQHALGTAWLVESGQLRQPLPDWPILQYIDGYPPAFDMVLSWVVALAGRIEMPLKAAAALVSAASVLAVYFLARRVTGSRDGAVYAAILYSVAPGAIGNHLWGHSLAIVLILTGLACTVELRRSGRLLPAAALCFGGAVLVAPSQGVKGLSLAALTAFFAWTVSQKWGRRLTLGIVAGCVVSAVWFVPLLARTGVEPSAVVSSMRHPELRRTTQEVPGGGETERLADVLRGSDHRRYGLDDWLFFRPHVPIQSVFGPKRINFIVPEGIGIPVFALTLLALLLPRRSGPGDRQPVPGTLLGVWLAFVVLGVAGASIGVSFFVWRFWMLLVPLASVAAAEGALRLSEARSRSRLAMAGAIIATALSLGQLGLALTTDTAAGLWRFWLLNPAFVIVVVAGAGWTLARLARAQGAPRRLAASIVLLHVAITASVRLRAITVDVGPTVFADAVESRGYLSLPDVTEPGELVFPLSGGDRCAAVVALDRACRPWDEGWHALQRRLAEDPCGIAPDALVSELRKLEIGSVVFDPSYRHELLASCRDPSRFRSILVEALRIPGVELVSSTPPPDQPSESRVVVVGIAAVSVGGS